MDMYVSLIGALACNMSSSLRSQLSEPHTRPERIQALSLCDVQSGLFYAKTRLVHRCDQDR